tara:strand:- start:129 stop:401 length:273 start_codon:yes stop_codon:yes gene_type:complete
MANVLKGYRGNKTGSFKEVENITNSYSSETEPVIGDDGKPIKGYIAPTHTVYHNQHHKSDMRRGYGPLVGIDGKRVVQSKNQEDVYFDKP